MRAAVVEDEKIIAERIKELTECFFGKRDKSIFVQVYLKGRRLLQDMEKGVDYDFVMMDLGLPDIDGLELLKKIKRCRSDIKVIIISAHQELAIACTHFGIFDFVRKTKMESELTNALARTLEEVEEDKSKCYLLQKSKDVKRIFFHSIYYIEMVERTAIIHCQDKTYSEYRPLREIYEMLPEKDFAYINKGQVVNLWRVMQTNTESVLLDNGEMLPLSRRKRKEFNNRVLEHQGRKT